MMASSAVSSGVGSAWMERRAAGVRSSHSQAMVILFDVRCQLRVCSDYWDRQSGTRKEEGRGLGE